MHKWTEAELAELENPDTWDWDSAQRYPPNPNAGSVFRVRLQGAELREIADAARAAGVTLATFLREAALKEARARQAGEGPHPSR